MNKHLPVIVFILTALIGLAMTYAVYVSARSTELVRFEVVANEAVDRLNERINQHIALLVATEAHMVSSKQFSKQSFAGFVNGLGLEQRYEGVRGIGFARIIHTGQEALAERQLLEGYGRKYTVTPQTNQRIRTPIVLLEPDDMRNQAALGFDMFSDQTRRNAMLQALVTGQVTASGPVELAQEITAEKQAGFLVYKPPGDARKVDIATSSNFDLSAGFVYAAFRAGDLHRAALDRHPMLPVTLETVDITDGKPEDLFRSANFETDASNGRFSVKRELKIAGRRWMLTLHETDAFSAQISYLAVFMLGSLSLLFAAALAVSTRSQLKAVETSKALQALSMKASDEKDMLLQEMKHRIKNSIARIMAMSRQTAANSRDLKEYSESFSARLQSMANAQDALAGSGNGRILLRQLLAKEIEQIFGKTFDPDFIEGPQIELDEKTSRALGLVFHELATNALKYGLIDNEAGGLKVVWSLCEVKSGGKVKSDREVRSLKPGGGKLETNWLEIIWEETSPGKITPPGQGGFGSKLIDANILGDLGGTLDRSFHESGLVVTMRFPFTSH